MNSIVHLNKCSLTHLNIYRCWHILCYSHARRYLTYCQTEKASHRVAFAQIDFRFNSKPTINTLYATRIQIDPRIRQTVHASQRPSARLIRPTSEKHVCYLFSMSCNSLKGAYVAD